ncbi:hypothetical protein H0H93_008990, partial [Arthromyces matolae]
MLFKQLLVAITIACVSYKAHCRICNSVVVESGASCNDTAATSGIDVHRLIEYNPGLNCSSLEAGKELCVELGVLPVELNNTVDGLNADNNTQAFVNDTDNEGGKPLPDIFEAFPPVEGVELAPDEALKEAPLHWDEPTPVEGSSCVAYGIRNYTSRIRG